MEKQLHHSDFVCILNNGSPYIRAVVSGPLGVKEEHEFLVDTGFSGFIAVPAETASALRLPFFTFGTGTLADDKSVITVLCEGAMTIDGETKALLTTIMPNSQSFAVGMGFLRTFGLTLYIEDQYFDLWTTKEKEVRMKKETPAQTRIQRAIKKPVEIQLETIPSKQDKE